jgi:1,4-alpha-glucan branching enzyme
VAPFQCIESHDHRRFINEFGELGLRDVVGEAYGNRERFYKEQPYVIGLYTGKGIPMLWHGQEFGENWACREADLAETSSSGRCTGSTSMTEVGRH